jgi:hypothetical protein
MNDTQLNNKNNIKSNTKVLSLVFNKNIYGLARRQKKFLIFIFLIKW